MLNFCDFIQVYVFSTNHHLKTTTIPLYNRLFIHDKIIWRVYITGYLLGEENLQPNKYPYDPPSR